MTAPKPSFEKMLHAVQKPSPEEVLHALQSVKNPSLEEMLHAVQSVKDWIRVAVNHDQLLEVLSKCSLPTLKRMMVESVFNFPELLTVALPYASQTTAANKH